MKETEIDALAMPWVNARVAYLLSVHGMTTLEVGDGIAEEPNPDNYDQVMFTQTVETIEPFSSCVVWVKAKRAYTGERINIMVQALHTEDGSFPQGQHTHMELRQGSKKAVVVVRNSTAYSQTLWKKTPVARAVAALPVPELPLKIQLQDEGDEPQGPHAPRLTVRQRHGELFDELDLSGLDSWPLKLADAACKLLTEYHDMLSLDPVELGCIHSTEHMIKVTDDTPFKEQFRHIPPPLVEEVWNHLWEMLELGTIQPSQSVWCNVVVLVRKKDGSLCFCINFCHLNTHTKKDSYPLPRIQEALESLVGAGHFSCLGLKSGFWQIKMEEASKQYTTFTVGNLGFFECDHMPFGLCNALATFQQLMQNCLGKLNLLHCLIYLDDLIMFLQTAEEHLHRFHIMFDWLREYNLKLKPLKCSLFKEEINYLAHQVSKQGVWPSDVNLKAIAECVPLQTYMKICTFLGLVDHYRWFIKVFTWIAQPLNKHLTGEGASKKLEWILLSKDALEAFQALKQACMSTPILAFATYTKDFLLETDTSKERLGAVLSQKQPDGHYHPIAYGS